MAVQNGCILRLVFFGLIVVCAHAAEDACVDFDNIDPLDARDVYVTVASSDCRNPIGCATITQSCSGSREVISTTEISPGIYKYTTTSQKQSIVVSKTMFRNKGANINQGRDDVTIGVSMKCKRGRICTTDIYQLTVNPVCSTFQDDPLVLSLDALSIQKTNHNVFDIELCSVPAKATIAIGDDVQSIDITSKTQTVDINCNGCQTMELTLTSACDTTLLISGAVLSLKYTEVRPGTYLVDVCEGNTEITATKFGYQDLIVSIPSPIGDAKAFMTCTEMLTMVKQPQSKFRNTGDDVTLCCEAISTPGTETITYQWMKDGTSIAEATSNKLQMTDLAASQSGEYKCVASIAVQSISVVSNTATLLITDDNLLAVQPNIQTICGETINAGACMNVPCKVAASSLEFCYDDGVISVMIFSFPTVSSCNVPYRKVESCACHMAPDVTVTVTVMDADTHAPLAGMVVEVLGESIMATSGVDGIAMLTLPAGTTTTVLDVTDASNQYLDTKKVIATIVGSSVDVTVNMYQKPTAIQIDPSVENVLSVSETPTQEAGSVNLNIPPNAFFTASGELVEGPVNVLLKVIPPTVEITETSPGVFMARDTNGEVTELETGGVFTISAEDENGNRVASLPIQVEAKNEFKLWELRADGTWALVTVDNRRRRRQSDPTSVYDFIGEVGIDTTGVRWYNIDKFPENTPCWFKAKIYDIGSGNPIVNDGTARYTALTVAVTGDPATSIFPLQRSTYMPSDDCFEIRCDNPTTGNVPYGYIAIEAIQQNIITERATPFDLSQYTSPVQTRMIALNYNINTPTSLRIDLTSSVDGPFFDNKATCEAAGKDTTEMDNVLRFTIKPPTYADPYDGSDDRCVARVLIEDPWDQNTTTASRKKRHDMTKKFYAISQWVSYNYYAYAGIFSEDLATGEITMCMEYRCSQPLDFTSVTISFDEKSRKSYCNLTFEPPLVSSTDDGYFFNSDGNAGAAVAECEADGSLLFAYIPECDQTENGRK